MSLVEYLPSLHFQGSTQGVVLAIFNDGRAFFYPLSEETKDRTYQNAVLLNNSPPTKQSASRASKAGSEKYFLYDACLELKHQVAKFEFSRDQRVLERPRKILLSPNKSLLLILGAYHNNAKCLLVYQLLETFPNPFHLIFSDFAFTFVDACFSPDSRSLVCITARHPHYLFSLSLPLIECPHNKQHEYSTSLFLSASSKKNVEHHVHARPGPTSFEPREAGPLQVMGPCLSVTGQPLAMTHIVSGADREETAYHFLTWGDGALGEFCLWKALQDPASGRRRYHMFPRLLCPDVTDLQWLSAPESPKARVVGAQFAEPPLERVLLVVKRDRFGKGPENGIGLQTCELGALDAPGVWYQVTESQDVDDVVCAKWTTPLLVGKEPSAAIVVRKKGMFELVAHRYTSAFQAGNESFAGKCTSFVQVGRYNRYWTTSDGELRAFVVTPSVPSQHPEWADMCRGNPSGQSQDIVQMRILGRRIGYFIQDALREAAPTTLEAIYTARKGKGAAKKSANGERVIGDCDVVDGIHLHRCWQCHVVLLKPLLCSRCKTAVYCGSGCQQKHWEGDHSRGCVAASKGQPH